jgi:hypothetical protein
MIGAALALRRAPQARIARDHLGHRHARAQPLAQLPERPVRHTGHGCDDQIVPERVRTDLHGRGGWSEPGYSLGDFFLRLLLAGALAILLPIDRRERAQF